MEPAKDEKLLQFSNEQLNAIYDSGKEATVALLKYLINEINNLKAELYELKNNLSKNSHNSNKPPSTDNMLIKPKSLRKKTGQKPGGQKGHKGSSLNQVINPDKVEYRTPEGKCNCGKPLKKAKVIDFVVRQLFDIKFSPLFVTEFRGEVKECGCGQIHYPDFPEDVIKEVQYGKNIKSLVVYLKHYGFISYERVADLFADVFGINISQGTFVNFINECAELVQPVVDEIKETLKGAAVLHCDESGMRIEKSTHWLHSAGTEYLTLYYPHKYRGMKAMEAMGILPEFKGTVIHDHWFPYFRYTQCLHGLCNAHNLRELIFFEENGEKWAAKIKRCLLSAKNEKDANKVFTEKQIKKYKQKMSRLINDGFKEHPEMKKNYTARGRPSQSKEFNLLRRLYNRLNEVLRFIIDGSVPFDNNQGERDIRMLKIQQKVSGSFRSLKGARSFCLIRSYISSIRKCGQSVFEALTSVWSKAIILPKALLRAE
jgi:transposase